MISYEIRFINETIDTDCYHSSILLVIGCLVACGRGAAEINGSRYFIGRARVVAASVLIIEALSVRIRVKTAAGDIISIFVIFLVVETIVIVVEIAI
jgi:hypothetical protein